MVIKYNFFIIEITYFLKLLKVLLKNAKKVNYPPN